MVGEGEGVRMDSYTSFDFETTGFSPERDRIIQAGVCVVTDGEVTARDGWLVRQDVPSSPDAQKVHGISDAAIQAQGIAPKESLTRLLAYLKDAPMCMGHNIHRFDVPFMEAEAKRLKVRIPPVADYVDTAALFKGWKLGIARGRSESHREYAHRVLSMRVRGLKYAIPVCLHELGIHSHNVVAHEAESDAYSAHLIFEKLVGVLGRQF